MARSYTSINHGALSSDTLAAANDTTQALFWRILCIADDWGRFPNNPGKVRRLMQDFNHTTEQIAEAIAHFVEHGSISTYEIDDLEVCQWNKWDEYQTMRFKNEALLPNRDGEYEESTNPLAGQRSRNQSKSDQIKSNHIKSNDGALEDTNDKHKSQHKDGGPNPTAKSQELIRKLVATGKKFNPVKEPDVIRQAAVIDLINRKGPEETRDFHPDKLVDALIWAIQDEDFWQPQVKSCLGLRRRAKNGCLKYENIITAFERYHEKRFKTEWKSPEQRKREADEQRGIQAENKRRRIQKEKQLKAEQKERKKQAAIDRKDEEAAAAKAKADEQERLKHFIPDADKFMKLWASKPRGKGPSEDDIRAQIIGWMSEGMIAGKDLIKKLKGFDAGDWLEFQKMLIT